MTNIFIIFTYYFWNETSFYQKMKILKSKENFCKNLNFHCIRIYLYKERNKYAEFHQFLKDNCELFRSKQASIHVNVRIFPNGRSSV